MAALDWETLRHALAIGNAGSIGGAARALGVNHTTVLRRLEALETQLGTRLFERKRTGYQPTEAGLALLEQARHMATRADEVERQVLGRDRELTGALRLTTAFVLMDHLLPQPLAEFANAYPGIGIGVLPTFMEQKHPELVAVSEPIAELAQPVWMLTHPDLRRTARVRAFMQFVGDALKQRLEQWQ